MPVWTDYEGAAVRVTEERLSHVFEHPEMLGQEVRINETLSQPELVIQSRSDPSMRLVLSPLRSHARWREVSLRGGKIRPSRLIPGDRVLHRQAQERRSDLESQVKIWFDPEADYLEVLFEDKPGFFRETRLDQVMAKITDDGQVIGFSIFKVSSLKDRPVEVSLTEN